MASEGTRLLAEGTSVTLRDGVERRLVIDMEALAVIEERVGSLSAYVEGSRRGMKGKHVGAVLAGLEAGLRHYRDQYGDPLFSRKTVAALMQFDRLSVYAGALDQAWAAGIPMAAPGKVDASSRTRRSRGKNSTAEPRSTTGEATPSSGA